MSELDFLVGTWVGEGKGEYPTAEPFSYAEEVTFRAIPGKDFLAYEQRTWHPEKRFPMHTECGYWRSVGPGRVEIVLSHPTGIVEIQEGTVQGTRIEVASTTVARTSTAKEVTELRRTLEIEDGTLRYELRMAAVGQGLGPHLSAELRLRSASPP
jgi:hypothetical protein